MKSRKKSITGILTLVFSILGFAFSSSLSARDYYQIKVYTIKNSDQESRVDDYLRNAYLPAMHRAGIKKVGVFKPRADDPAAGTKVFVFIPLKKMDQIEKIAASLAKDNEYHAKGAAYINAAFDHPPYQRIESILLKAFDKQPNFFTPELSTPKSEQVFELRSYQSATEKIHDKKVKMFNEGGETAIFKELGCNAVFYGQVISGSEMPNLMYLTSYSDIKSNEDHWKAFRNHPDWKRLSGMEEYKHTVSHIDKYMLSPTDYSDI